MFRQLRRSYFSHKSVPLSLGKDANEEVLFFRGHTIYVRRRPYKRSMGITLQANGRIDVRAPKMATLIQISEFLENNSEWLMNHLKRYDELRRRYPPKRFVEGEGFLFLGEPMPLRFAPGSRNREHFIKTGDAILCEIPSEKWLTFDRTAPHYELQKNLIDFYERAGRALLTERIAVYSERMDLWPTGLSFRSQKTRWGSCSSKGRVSLNWRLIVAPLSVIDYVVVHELAHLRFYNHSAAFWNLVSKFHPAHEDHRQWLRSHQYETDFLARKSDLHPSGHRSI